MVTDGFDHQPNFNIEEFSNYDVMKEKLAIQVVSTERNAEMLENIPHKEVEDMSLVCRFIVGDTDFGMGSILVNNDMLQNYGITTEQLFADAAKYAPELRPSEIMSIADVLAQMMGIDVSELNDQMGVPGNPDIPMYVASTHDKSNGAGIIAYPGFMEMAAEKIGGECLGLRWSDLDFDGRMITVSHSLAHKSNQERKTVYSIQTPKTKAGIRTIPMISEVRDAFVMEYEIQKCIGFCRQEIDGYSGFVFSSSDGHVYSPEAINQALYRIRDSYNEEEKVLAKKEKREPILLPQFSCHILRHTFCTRLCENESNIKVIQSVMGHRDISTTMDIYADCTDDKKQEVLNNLDGKIIIK